MSIHFHKLIIKDVRKETPECISVAFEVPEELRSIFQFRQGQNITVRQFLNNEELRRSYSICSSPMDNELRIAIKHAEGGVFSSWANQNLVRGQALDVLPPTGTFYTELEPDKKRSYLAFAAGSGITPVISIISTILAKEPQSRFTLVYGNRTRNSIIFKEQLEALKNRYMSRFAIHHVLSREKTDSDINYGRIDAEKCSVLAEKLVDIADMDEIFLCGPEQMIFTVRDWLLQYGIEPRKIHFELFTVPGEQQKKQYAGIGENAAFRDEKAKITIRLDGVSFDFELAYEGNSVLDEALNHGADLPFSCKGGVCSTCRAKLVQGRVEMEANYALSPEELAAGFILTCQSHPRSPRLLIDFDDR
jgi:ring-1,2-phenylacetyl-CoA epoxidase subunit PaaE